MNLDKISKMLSTFTGKSSEPSVVEYGIVKEKGQSESKDLQQVTEVKSGSLNNGYWSGCSFPEYLSRSGYGDLSAYAASALYTECMPFFNAVNMRAEAFSEIPPRIKEKGKDGQFIDEHPVLNILDQPNADVSGPEFMEQLSSFYDIAGETFIIAMGRINAPPKEIAVVEPQKVTFSNRASQQFGALNVPSSIRVSNYQGAQIIFHAVEYPNELGLRYVNETEDAEIWHIRAFNPFRSSSNFRGMSRARSVWLEMQQYISGNVTNLSMLKRGSRISMAWVNKSGVPLTDEQWARIQEEAQKYAGDANAGGTPVLDGLDVSKMQQTNREMEFKDLQESTLARISSVYRIPLAFLLQTTMTFNNLETSMLQFYDNSALPLASRLFNEMTRMLMPRYQNSMNLQITYNQNDIPALQIRILEATKRKSEINVNTIDELRDDLGDKPLDDGGGEVYRNSNLLPVGESDNLGESEEELTTDDF